jgi:glycerophosphoryl diester phosphodiesterase
MAPKSRCRVLAHRGASVDATENSLAAFRRAVELEADGVELDVHASADGTLVVHHDPVIPGLGHIADLSARSVLAYRLPNGEPVPSLERALDAIGAREVWIEVKSLPPRFDQRLVAALRAGPPGGTYGIHSFDHRIIARLGRAAPGLRRGVLLSSYLADPVAALAAVGASVLWQEWHLIDVDQVDRIHAAGYELIAWTVDEAAACRQLAAWGVDALCGNRPDRIRAALAAN